MSQPDDALVVAYTPVRGPRRRLVIRETEDGLVRREEEWTGCVWRPVGTETLDAVDVTDELPTAVLTKPE
ncbi:hypothetical protein [Halosegnis longus]|uniref:hypothetical protein n=1 Tax=Halosegnis longus TaxID=2216012 RepID=UPI00129EC438|nr:hypothetical protein [Halosegnis longus]